jgi:hypothetical protein
MDPKTLSTLDPKLRDAYERVMGTTAVPKAAPNAKPTPPVATPVTPAAQPSTPLPAPSLNVQSIPETSSVIGAAAPGTSFTQMPQQIAVNLPVAPPSSAGSSANTLPGYAANIPAASKEAPKKKGLGIFSLFVTFLLFVFFLMYTIFWVKFFKISIPFLS